MKFITIKICTCLACISIASCGWQRLGQPPVFTPEKQLWVKANYDGENFALDEKECWAAYRQEAMRPSADAASARSANEQCYLDRGYQFTNQVRDPRLPICGHGGSNPNGPACKSIGR